MEWLAETFVFLMLGVSIAALVWGAFLSIFYGGQPPLIPDSPPSRAQEDVDRQDTQTVDRA